MRGLTPGVAFALVAFALIGAAAPVVAKPTDAQLDAIKANCRSDFMSNCWGVKRGGVEAMQCLQEHMASLSPGCQTAVKAATAQPAPATPAKAPESAPPAPAPAPATAKPAAPAAPVTQPTAETPPPAPSAETKAATPAAAPEPAPAVPPKATAAPAAKPPAPVPPPAAAAAPAAPEAAPPIIGFIPPRKKFMVQRNCRQDLETYCADVDIGDGRVLRCLFSHKSALTPDCQGALAKLAE